MVTYKKASGTAGFDFDHGVIGRLVAEIQYGAVLDYDALALMNTEEQTVQFALMYSKSFLRESLTLNGQLIGFDIDASGGRMQTLSLDYDLSDSLSTMIKLIDYVDGDYVFLNGADDRDRIITEIRYAF
jgi:hypothetical protein